MNERTHIQSTINKRRQDGLTLVELMVSIVLGLLLVAAVMQSYLSTKQTYRMTQGVNRVQENSRFAMHFLTGSIRKAGNLGCVDEVRNLLNDSAVLNLERELVGWNFSGTNEGDNYTLPANYVPSGSVGAWDNGGDPLPGELSGRVLPGSDVIVINSFVQTDIVLQNVASVASTSIPTQGSHDLENNQILMVGDCYSADFFQHSGGAGNSLNIAFGSGQEPGNENPADGIVWGHTWGPDSTVYRLDTNAYYVGLGSNDQPALFRLPLGAGGVGQDPLELVEGVENMQIFYGEDIDGDRSADRYVSADQVSDWDDNVVSARIGLLMVSSENVSDEEQASDFELLDSITLNLPSSGDPDLRLRYAVNSVIKPRNMGIGRTYSVCDAGISLTSALTGRCLAVDDR